MINKKTTFPYLFENNSINFMQKIGIAKKNPLGNVVSIKID